MRQPQPVPPLLHLLPLLLLLLCGCGPRGAQCPEGYSRLDTTRICLLDDEGGAGSSVDDHLGSGVDLDDDGVTSDEDCDDEDPDVHPEHPELCDELDNDCDGDVDEDVKPTWYVDDDGDGYGNPYDSVEACEAPLGYVSNDDDCYDQDAQTHPGAAEECGDGIDTDCDGDSGSEYGCVGECTCDCHCTCSSCSFDVVCEASTSCGSGGCGGSCAATCADACQNVGCGSSYGSSGSCWDE